MTRALQENIMTIFSSSRYVIASVVIWTVLFGSVLTIGSLPAFAQSRFQVEEATIDDIHEAIQQGRTTCV